MAAHSKGRLIFTHYLNWERAVTDMGFFPIDLNDRFPDTCRDLLESGYYIRSGGQILGLPRSKDPIMVCNAVFERFNRDDRHDRKWRRSFSVADIVQIDQAYFVCRSIGWHELNLTQKVVIKSDEG